MKETKLFFFGDVFTYCRGSRLIEVEQVSGNVAYISSSKKNNGISVYITPPNFMKRYKRKITLTNSGSVGYAFYHEYEFVASDHVTIIGIKDEFVELTNEIAIYLKPIFESMKSKYNFGREISDKRLAKERILLPVNGDMQPDWEYMHLYIKNLFPKINWEKITYEYKKNNLYSLPWAEFKMIQIFDFRKGKRLTKENMTSGKTNFIGAISINNGIRQQISEEPLYEGNCITVNYNGSVGEAFYQKDPFWASDDVNVLFLKDKKLNIYLALFLIAIIKQNKEKFDFGRKWNTEKMKNTKISLPVLAEGNPDWKFMEKYIYDLPYGEKLRGEI